MQRVNLTTACVLLGSSLLLGGWGAQPLGLYRPAAGSITTFDVPGAGGYTIPIGINDAGAIAGIYQDASYKARGFVLNALGTYSTFDAPGAAHGTYPGAINNAGTVIGTYADANNVTHGFAMATDGTFTELLGPGGFLLSPSGIGPTGDITGSYNDIDGLTHGFRLTKGGRFLPFEAPGAGIISGEGTRGLGIDRTGEIAGIYADLDGHRYPYARSKSGVFTTLIPPGSFVSNFAFEYSPRMPPQVAINVHGAVAGSYFQAVEGIPFGGYVNGFIQTVGGAPITFGIGDNGCCIFTYVTALNNGGAVTGYDDDDSDINHGYIRTPNGTITIFDAPGAGTLYFQGTLPTAINAGRIITGTYEDNNYQFHGFIRQP